MLDDPSPYLYLLLVILIMCSAFFSATETAFATVNRIRIKNKIADGNQKAEKVLRVAEDYDRAISAILIGNNIVNIAASSIATILFTNYFGTSGAAISTVVMTLLVLTFGEVLPKSYAKANADTWVFHAVDILDIVMKVFRPLVAFFLMLTNLAGKKSKNNDTPSVTEQELKYIIEESQSEGVLEEQESELVQSALDFDEITVDEILTPRVDVIAISEQEDIERVRELFFTEGYSRLPVYSGNIDHVIGIVHNKDFFKAYIVNKNVDLKSIMQRTIYVPPKKFISEVLKELQKLKSHMAIVTDQYGGTIGIITLEDIIEELVGDIWDESDEEEIEMIQLDENRYQVSGDMDPEDFFDNIKFSYNPRETEDFPNSFAGWALENFERIPDNGDSFWYQNLEITVTEVTDQRIVTLQIIVHPPQEEETKE